uniref:Uncharacterized protein n=1 Tax=Vespula pensylvanica TaxID=30213 RepID=A0A834N784_VESPE|nr:hypothetical protein H0235_016323 [Vespula pensylvanica]
MRTNKTEIKCLFGLNGIGEILFHASVLDPGCSNIPTENNNEKMSEEKKQLVQEVQLEENSLGRYVITKGYDHI